MKEDEQEKLDTWVGECRALLFHVILAQTKPRSDPTAQTASTSENATTTSSSFKVGREKGGSRNSRNVHLTPWGCIPASEDFQSTPLLVSMPDGQDESRLLDPTLEAQAESEAAWIYLKTCLQGLIWHIELADLKARKEVTAVPTLD